MYSYENIIVMVVFEHIQAGIVLYGIVSMVSRKLLYPTTPLSISDHLDTTGEVVG